MIWNRPWNRKKGFVLFSKVEEQNDGPALRSETDMIMMDLMSAMVYSFMPHVPYDGADDGSFFVKDLMSEYFTDAETEELGIAIYAAQDYSSIGK